MSKKTRNKFVAWTNVLQLTKNRSGLGKNRLYCIGYFAEVTFFHFQSLNVPDLKFRNSMVKIIKMFKGV